MFTSTLGRDRWRVVHEWVGSGLVSGGPVSADRHGRLWSFSSGGAAVIFEGKSDYLPGNGRRAWVAARRPESAPAPARLVAAAVAVILREDPRAAIFLEDGVASLPPGFKVAGALVDLPGRPQFVAAGLGGLRALKQLVKQAMERLMPPRLFVTQERADSGAIYLTFDDGPDPDETPRLLDALKHHGIPATFFVIGARAAAHPELVKRMVAEGHAVGSHSWYHNDAKKTSARQLVDETRRARELIVSLGGSAHLCRPPYGAVGPRKLLGLWAARQRICLWNVDPRDYALDQADELARWFELRPLEAGDIVLLHDPTPHTRNVLPALVADVRARGLRFAAMT